MRKIQLKKELRLSILTLCTLALGLLVVLMYINFKNPGFVDKKVSLYNYSSLGKVDYQVSLKPNSLYNQKVLGEDQVYLTNLVDTIDSIFSYEFSGESAAEIKGNYEIVAVIEGSSGEGDKLTTLWQKQIPLIPKTDFQANDKKLAITKKIPLDINAYNAIVKKIADETKVNAQTKVTAIMNVNFNAQTDQGVIDKKSISSLAIPLTGNYFKITKTPGENKPEALEKVEQISKPFDKRLTMLYGAAIVIALAILLYTLFGTKGLVVDQKLKEIKKIFKKHGTRLVALNSEIAAASELQNEVLSMEDLVRISDELGKPIIYKHSDDDREKSKFWVIDEDRFYVFRVEETDSRGLFC